MHDVLLLSRAAVWSVNDKLFRVTKGLCTPPRLLVPTLLPATASAAHRPSNGRFPSRAGNVFPAKILEFRAASGLSSFMLGTGRLASSRGWIQGGSCPVPGRHRVVVAVPQCISNGEQFLPEDGPLGSFFTFYLVNKMRWWLPYKLRKTANRTLRMESSGSDPAPHSRLSPNPTPPH